MHHQATIKYCLLALLLLAFLPGYGQKIREKKDIVYVDDVAQYKFYRTKGKFNSPDIEKVVTTMNDDTLVWMRRVPYAMLRLEHEDSPLRDYYWEMRFAGTDSILEYKQERDYLYVDLINKAVLKDGRLELSALPAIRERVRPYISLIHYCTEADAHRAKLASMPAYKDYCKGLAKRNANNKLRVEQGNIYFQNSSGAAPEQIGTYQKVQPRQGLECHVFLKGEREPVAVIAHNLQTGKSSIKTRFDHASYDYEEAYSEAFYYNAVAYLAWHGYL